MKTISDRRSNLSRGVSTEAVQARLSQKETVDHLVRATRRWTPLMSKKVFLAAVLGLSATGVACGYSIYRIQQSEKDFNALRRAHITAVASQALNAIQRQLETSVSSTKALSALIHLDEGNQLMEPLRSEIQELRERCKDVADVADAPAAAQETALEAKKAAVQQLVMNASKFEFNTVAESLIRSYKGISNLQLAPAGVVSVIYPIQGSEGAIGHDLFFDPQRRADAIKAIVVGGIIFVGPVRLIQNGKIAIIARNPTFINRPGFIGQVPEYPSWWGFTTMLCTLDDLFAPTPLANVAAFQVSFLMYAMTSSGKKFLRSSADVVDVDDSFETKLDYATQQAPEMVEFHLPELQVHWVMLAWPQTGWKAYSDTFVWQVLLCTLFTVCTIVSVYSVMVRESVIQQVEGILRPTLSAPLTLDSPSQTASWGEKLAPPLPAARPRTPADPLSVVPL